MTNPPILRNMAIYSIDGRTPRLGKGCYVDSTTTIIGDVTIGDNVWLGPGSVVRGDYGTIRIGSYSAVEDNVVIHARPGEATLIGEHVTLGHSCIVHTGTVKDWAVIGMGAIVSDFAVVGEWAAVGEGAVVKNRDTIPDRSVAVGVPAKVVGSVGSEYLDTWTKYKERYNKLCSTYTNSLRQIHYGPSQ
ncbi:MAG: gamma carbonic anhydrase family protein [Thermoplasmataceae archaeon]